MIINRSNIDVQKWDDQIQVNIPNHIFWGNKVKGAFTLLGTIILLGMANLLLEEDGWRNFNLEASIISISILLFGLNGLRQVLQSFYGARKITFDDKYLRVKNTLFGIGRQKRYRLTKVKDVEIKPLPTNELFALFGGAAFFLLKFKYGRRTVDLAVVKEGGKELLLSKLPEWIQEVTAPIPTEVKESQKLYPKEKRAIVEQTIDGMKIRIPAKKHWGIITFLTFWMIPWAFGEYYVARLLFLSSIDWFAKPLLTAWLLFWTAGGISILLSILWQLFGKEEILMEGYFTKVENTIFGRGLKRQYETNRLKEIKFQAPIPNLLNKQIPFLGGKVQMNYGEKTIRILREINEIEAQEILAQMKSYPKFSAEQFI
ncbi:MAG: hypothetical protein MK226_07465 [Saprospiraceae bacterium]|nr:hypothetical protein [Saprospiraceae bacterium]